MANQCVSELTIIGPEEVVRKALWVMIANLKKNGVVDEESPVDGATVQQLAEWVSGYTRSPSCFYLEALCADKSITARPMGWDAEVLVRPYGELVTMRMDFDTAWGPAESEVNSFVGSLSFPCGVYFKPDDDYEYADMWCLKDGDKGHVELMPRFERFKKRGGEIGVFYAQMHKAITNRLPKL